MQGGGARKAIRTPGRPGDAGLAVPFLRLSVLPPMQQAGRRHQARLGSVRLWMAQSFHREATSLGWAGKGNADEFTFDAVISDEMFKLPE